MIPRLGLLALLGSAATACGGESSDGDADADTDADTDTGTGGGACGANCRRESDRCGSPPDECVSSCEAAGAAVDTEAWTGCLDGLNPPCGYVDENCCIAAMGCRGF